MRSQEKSKKIFGMGRVIARKVGCSEDYVSRVLSGKVNQRGKKARHINEVADTLNRTLEEL